MDYLLVRILFNVLFFLIGWILSDIIFGKIRERKKSIGTINVVESETEGSYLYLALNDASSLEHIKSQKTVTFKVDKITKVD